MLYREAYFAKVGHLVDRYYARLRDLSHYMMYTPFVVRNMLD
jgi:hypothetical protein